MQGRSLTAVKAQRALISFCHSEKAVREQSMTLIGHNARGAMIKVEARFFNSLAKYSGHEGLCTALELPAGATVGDIIHQFKIPLAEVFLVLRNGRDISPGLYEGGNVNQEAALDDGDVIALSGPVPYSYGYGAPVV
jgi:hypothetical protein